MRFINEDEPELVVAGVLLFLVFFGIFLGWMLSGALQ